MGPADQIADPKGEEDLECVVSLLEKFLTDEMISVNKQIVLLEREAARLRLRLAKLIENRIAPSARDRKRP